MCRLSVIGTATMMTHRSSQGRPEMAPSPAQISDDMLVARMKADDTEAYRLLVERHIDRAYGLAFRILRNQADAEDVAQEALVKAWTHRHGWEEGRARFGTWLYRVVVNRCIDLKRMPRSEWIEDVPEPAEDAADAVDGIHQGQVKNRLEDAMGRLPAQQRAALTLAYFDDMGNAEIAQVLDTTVQAVESLLKRGRQRLRELLARAERDIRASFTER